MLRANPMRAARSAVHCAAMPALRGRCVPLRAAGRPSPAAATVWRRRRCAPATAGSAPRPGRRCGECARPGACAQQRHSRERLTLRAAQQPGPAAAMVAAPLSARTPRDAATHRCTRSCAPGPAAAYAPAVRCAARCAQPGSDASRCVGGSTAQPDSSGDGVAAPSCARHGRQRAPPGRRCGDAQRRPCLRHASRERCARCGRLDSPARQPRRVAALQCARPRPPACPARATLRRCCARIRCAQRAPRCTARRCQRSAGDASRCGRLDSPARQRRRVAAPSCARHGRQRAPTSDAAAMLRGHA